MAAQQREVAATAKVKELKDTVGHLEREILEATHGRRPDDLANAPKILDVDKLITAQQEKIANIKRIDGIRMQPTPKTVTMPTLDFDALREILATTLEDVHAQAEMEVRAHFRRYDDQGIRDWAEQGTRLLRDETCPFCGNSVSENSLIKSYQQVFNQAYNSFTSSVADAKESVIEATGVANVDAFRQSHDQASGAINTWRGSGAAIHELAVPDFEALTEDLTTCKDHLVGLLEQKRNNLESPIELSEDSDASKAWDRAMDIFSAFNSAVDEANTVIEKFKLTLSQADVDEAEAELESLTTSKLRHSEPVATLLRRWTEAKQHLNETEKKRVGARADLKEHTQEVLTEFGDAINNFLEREDASFRLSGWSSNYLGGKPRAEYKIELRNHAVALSGSNQSFATALSESDKRTMAFAFFMAATRADPQLKERIVVIDDPMSSLDHNRRTFTVQAIVDLALKCRQVIVLAHDPQFLLDVDSALANRTKTSSEGTTGKILRSHIKIVPHIVDADLPSYSDFADCDLPRECESKYARNYRILEEFVKCPSQDKVMAAQAIRPLLEGYLHRRFPTALPKNCMLGQALRRIEDASPPSPLVHAKNLVETMRQLAYFGNPQMHDNDPNRNTPSPSLREIQANARDALRIVHGAWLQDEK